MLRRVRGVRMAEDIEHIHDMRVASRRLRTALLLFDGCLPASKLERWNKVTRRLRRALGTARDTDVQIELVQSFLQQLKTLSHQAGVERLLLRLRQRRQLLQQKVEKDLHRLETSALAMQVRQTCDQLRARAKRLKAGVKTPGVYGQAQKWITLQLKELLDFEPYVDQPKCIRELHQMRIAAKHLRYTMEVFAHLYDDKLKTPIKTARDAQTLLGAVHDADVWLDYVPRFLEEERQRAVEYFGNDKAFAALRPGVRDFLRSRRKARAGSYSEFRRFWRDARKRKVWESLVETLRLAAASTARQPREESQVETK